MKSNFFTYILPITLSILTAVLIIIFKTSVNSILPQIPYDLYLFGAVIYAVVLVFGLQYDLKEKLFWKIVLWSVSLNFIGAVLRTYVWPFLNIPEFISIMTLVLYIVAMFLIVVGLFKLMNILGIDLESKTKGYINISYILLFVIFILILAPIVIKTSFNLESIATYIVLAIFCALSIPLAVVLYQYTKTGALRTPFLFISLSVISLAIQVIGIIFALANNVPVPNLEVYVFVPYILFIMFAMMAISSRIVIARKINIYLDS